MSVAHTAILAVRLLGARFGGAAISLTSQVLLARLLSQSDVGIVFMGMSAAAFISLIASAGYPQLAVTTVPRYYTLARVSLLNGFQRAFWRDSFLFSIIFILLAALIYVLSPISDGAKLALVFGCLSAPASALLRMNGAIANSLRRYDLSYVPDFLYRPGLLLLFLLVVWFAGLPLSAITVLLVFVASNMLVAAGQTLALGRESAFRGLSKIFQKPRHAMAPRLRNRAVALVLVGLVATGFADIVTLLAGTLLPPDQVAIVGVTVRLAALAGFIIQATQQFILPDLTDAIVRGTAGSVQNLLLRANVVSLGVMIACLLGAAILGPYVLRVYGAQYVQGHWPLVIFMLSQAFRAASGMNQHLLSLKGYQTQTALACVTAVISLAGSAHLLTPLWGLNGLAVAVLISEIVWAAMLAAQAQRLTGRRGDLLALLYSYRGQRSCS